MALERVGECTERAMRETRFRNIWGHSFDASAMRELYARKRHRQYRLTEDESIGVGERELAELVAAIAPILAPYRAANTYGGGQRPVQPAIRSAHPLWLDRHRRIESVPLSGSCYERRAIRITAS